LAFTFFSAKKVNKKTPNTKNSLNIVARIRHGFAYVLRTFLILSLPAKSPVSRLIKSGHPTSSNSFVLVSLLFHLSYDIKNTAPNSKIRTAKLHALFFILCNLIHAIIIDYRFI